MPKRPPIPEGRSIGPNELQFVEHYIRSMNAKTSYEQAFDYSGPNGAVLGFKLLQRPAVQAAIEVRRQQLAAELDVTPGEVIRRMMFIGYADLGGLVDDDGKPLPLKQLPRELRLALAEVKVLQTIRSVDVKEVKKGTAVEVKTVSEVKIINYKLAPKLAALVELGVVIGLGKMRDNRGLEELSLEELERLEKANEAACEAIRGAQSRADRIVKSAVKKMTAGAMAGDEKPKGNGKANGKGGNGHGGNGTKH